jgi:DNA-binding PadR family transcriptional regulator
MSVPDGLLVLLREGPRHGYQLATEFAERTADRWSLNTGQVYTTLDRLVRDGFVEPDEGNPGGDDRRRTYRLTPAGALRAETWLASAPPAPEEQRDELVLRVLLVASVAPTAAVGLIDRQRRNLVERLQDLRRRQREGGGSLLSRLSDDAVASRLEADVRWLDLCEERLRAARSEEDPR